MLFLYPFVAEVELIPFIMMHAASRGFFVQHVATFGVLSQSRGLAPTLVLIFWWWCFLLSY